MQNDKLQRWVGVCDANTIVVFDMMNSIQTVMLKVVLERLSVSTRYSTVLGT